MKICAEPRDHATSSALARCSVMIASARRIASVLLHRGFPFLVSGDDADPLIRLRRLAIRQRLSLRGGRAPWLIWLAMTLAWPVGAAIETRKVLRRIREEGATGPAGLLRWAVVIYADALRHNLPPVSYVTFGLHRPGRRHLGPRFLFWTEWTALPLLNAAQGADPDDVQDKAQFARLCERHGLPCIETLAVFRNGRQAAPAAAFVADRPALHVKSLTGSQRRGVGRWHRRDGAYHGIDGTVRSPDDLAAFFRGQDCIVQPLLENHPDLAPLSDGRLADVRIVTGIERDGRVRPVGQATMILPDRAGADGRNFLHAWVDIPSGRIDRAWRWSGPVERHPDTGTVLAGYGLPLWREAVDLVTRAHAAAFPRFVFLGWDVALTPAGAVLVETNSGWGAEIMQAHGAPPLGQDPVFIDILSQYV